MWLLVFATYSFGWFTVPKADGFIPTKGDYSPRSEPTEVKSWSSPFQADPEPVILDNSNWTQFQLKANTKKGTSYKQFEFPMIKGNLRWAECSSYGGWTKTVPLSEVGSPGNEDCVLKTEKNILQPLWYRPSNPTISPVDRDPTEGDYSTECESLEFNYTTQFLSGPIQYNETTGEVWGNGAIQSKCSFAGPGELSGYRLRIYKPGYSSITNPNYQTQKYSKPVIISQGFDPEYGTKKQFDFEQFAGQLNNTDGSLLESLLDQGHTVFLVLYEFPLDDIKQNAKVALRALQWIQQHTDDDLIVIGPSMGGLVMRKALQYAGGINSAFGDPSKSQIFPSLFIAYDSPNWGANIPVEIQATLKYLRKNSASAEQMDNNLTSKAAKQMLLISRQNRPDGRADHTVPGFFYYNYLANKLKPITNTSSDFLRDLNSKENQDKLDWLGGKQYAISKMQTVAISEGSGKNMQSGTSRNTRWAKIDTFKLYWRASTPNPGSAKSILDIEAANTYQWIYVLNTPVFIDGIPGSTRGSYPTIYNTIKKKMEPSSSQRYLNPNIIEHAFIPTVSALGLVDRNLNTEVGWKLTDNKSGLRTEPGIFDRAYLYGYDNRTHIKPNNTISNWILSEILEVTK
jgi:hypothetical protein